jgi:hypothetical protein
MSPLTPKPRLALALTMLSAAARGSGAPITSGGHAGTGGGAAGGAGLDGGATAQPDGAANISNDAGFGARGTLGAATFDGAAQLAAVVPKEPRFAACAARKALTYALGRSLGDDDRPRLAALTATWKQGSIRELLHAIVGSDAFRLRRGEEP